MKMVEEDIQQQQIFVYNLFAIKNIFLLVYNFEVEKWSSNLL